MADPVLDPSAQSSVEMPNGVTLTGIGGDNEALQEQFEERHEQRTGEAVESTVADAQGEPVTPEARQPRGKKRFEKLTYERDQEKARADAAEAKARDLEAKLKAPVVPSSTPHAPTPSATEQPTRPKPTEAEIGVKYQSLSDYIEDLSDWKLEQREAKLRADFDARLDQRIEADRTSRTRATVVNDVFTRGRAQFSDFDAVLKTADHITFTPQQRDAMLAMPNPEHVMYALAKDHAKLTQILAIQNPVQLGVALAQLIPHTEAVAPLASTPVSVRTTNAPAPPQPVGAGSRTAQPSLNELANAGNYEAYKARRDAERKTG